MVFDLNPARRPLSSQSLYVMKYSGLAQDVFHKKKPLANYVLHPIIFDI
jgi:hypothetical protein